MTSKEKELLKSRFQQRLGQAICVQQWAKEGKNGWTVEGARSEADIARGYMYAIGDATGYSASTNMCCTGAEAMIMMCSLLKRVAVLNGQPYEKVLRDFGHAFRVLVMDEEWEGGKNYGC